MDLSLLGWDDFFARPFVSLSVSGLVPARVALGHKHAFTLLSAHGELAAACTGRLLHAAVAPADLPVVGDWVAVRLRRGELRADIAALAARCRFGDCAHGAEPGCAVTAALDDGTLDPDRWQSFQKLRREQARTARLADPHLAREYFSGVKRITRAMRARHRFHPEA